MAVDRASIPDHLKALKAKDADQTSIKAAVIAIATVTEASLFDPVTHALVENVPEVLNTNVMKGLMNVVTDSISAGIRPAMNHALRAVADITQTQEGKKLFMAGNGLELFAKYLNLNVAKTSPGDHGEEFSFALMKIIVNVSETPQSLPQFLSANYPTLLLKYLTASAQPRPAAAIFSAYILNRIASTEDGRAAIMKGDLVITVKGAFKVAINDQGNSPEYVALLEECCRLISSICQNEAFVPQFITNGFITPLVKVCIAKKQNKYLYPISTLKAATTVLSSFVKNEVGADEVGQNTNIIILRNMLAQALTLDPKVENARATVTKICLAIGPLFGAEGAEYTVPAESLIKLLNKACVTYIALDNETSFITTSLLVHVGSFPDGALGLKLKETIQTSAQLLEILLTKEKAEDIQSIMRNVIIVIQGAVNPEFGGPNVNEQVRVFAEYNLFKLLEQTLVLQNELNSEITEIVLNVLIALSAAQAGLIEVKKLVPVIKTVETFFKDPGQQDERKDTIAPLATQLLNAAV